MMTGFAAFPGCTAPSLRRTAAGSDAARTSVAIMMQSWVHHRAAVLVLSVLLSVNQSRVLVTGASLSPKAPRRQLNRHIDWTRNGANHDPYYQLPAVFYRCGVHI